MSEYLYVAVNKSMPGLVKVGYTTREPRDRLRELHSTGVPTPFNHVVVLIVADGAAAEREAHQALDEFRMDRNREFFSVKPVIAVRRILKVVENYEIDWDNTTNLDEISELDRRNKLYLAEKDRKERERLTERERKSGANSVADHRSSPSNRGVGFRDRGADVRAAPIREGPREV